MKDLLESSAAGLGLVFNADLFVSDFPPEDISQANIVSLYDTGGEAPDSNMTYERSTFQVRVRNSDYDTGYDLAKDIMRYLNVQEDVDVDESRYIGVWATSDIFFVGRDDKRRTILTVNFRAHRTTV